MTWFYRDLDLGAEGEDVKAVQRKLGPAVTGTYDEPTAAGVRGFQRLWSLPTTGVVDEATARLLGPTARNGLALPPEWFHRDLRRGDAGADVTVLRVRMGVKPGDLFDRELEGAVRRFQSQRHRTPTGVFDLDDALDL